MLTLEELQKHVEDYKRGALDLDGFEDWFRSASRGLYESLAEVRAVESALSKYHFEGINEERLREELANASRPFASLESSTTVVYTFPKQRIAGLRPVAARATAVIVVAVALSVQLGNADAAESLAVLGRPLMGTASASSVVPMSMPVPMPVEVAVS